MSYQAIVIGSSHHNTYGVCRSLGENGIKPIVYIVAETESCFFKYSRYIAKIRFFKTDKQLLNHLTSVSHVGGVIFCCTDRMASFIDANKDKLAVKYILPGVRQGESLLKMMDKTWLAKAAVEAGLTIPETRFINTKRDVDWDKFPCIIKPLNSVIGCKNDIKICANQNELQKELHLSYHNQLLIQEYIEKDFEYQLIGVSLNEGSSVYIPGITRLIRPTDPRTNTGTVVVEPLDSFDIELEKVQRLIKATGYSGLFSAEFLRDATGTNYFMEVNFRNDGNSICMTAANANIHLAWYNQKYEEGTHIKRKFTMPLFPMVKRLFKGKLTLKDFMVDLSKNPCFMDFSWKDPITLLSRL